MKQKFTKATALLMSIVFTVLACLPQNFSMTASAAGIVGANTTKKLGEMTYYTGNGFAVSNFFGHLVGLALPPDYDQKYEKWDLADLPIAPQNWIYTPNKGTEKHLKSLIQLMNSPEIVAIINAADAGREGEWIFRYVYDYAKCTKPMKRLWISSLTDESIRNGMQNLLDGRQKDSLFASGAARAKSDWLIGINLSRLYSKIYNARLGVGRVTTPTLAMIVSRDNEISKFSKTKYYTLNLDNTAEYFVPDGGENTFSEKAQADRICEAIKGKNVVVITAETKTKSENRPQLHSLTSLQKEANDKHGLTAQQTVEALQSLYEKKLFTYPRTDSCHITEGMKKIVHDVVGCCSFFDGGRTSKLLSQGLNLDKRVVDDSKVSDHHAIIPTNEIQKFPTATLNDNEKIVGNLIINRFLLALDLPHIYNETEYIFDVENYLFRLVSRKTVTLNWREYDLKEEQKNHFSFQKGEIFPANVNVREKETSPPKQFTEATLLSAMENISRRIEDKSKAEFVKERGLGTPATRAGIIEELVKRGLCDRQGKNFISTSLGKQVISLLPTEVKSPQMTADMEEKLSEIENGNLSENAFLSEITEFIKTRISVENGKTPSQINSFSAVKSEKESIGKCLKCGKDVYESEKSYYCSDYKNCPFTIWKDNFFCKNFLFKLTKPIVKALITGKKVSTELTGKNGNKFSALVYLQKGEYKGKTVWEFKFDFAPKNDILPF